MAFIHRSYQVNIPAKIETVKNFRSLEAICTMIDQIIEEDKKKVAQLGLIFKRQI